MLHSTTLSIVNPRGRVVIVPLTHLLLEQRHLHLVLLPLGVGVRAFQTPGLAGLKAADEEGGEGYRADADDARGDGYLGPFRESFETGFHAWDLVQFGEDCRVAAVMGREVSRCFFVLEGSGGRRGTYLAILMLE